MKKTITLLAAVLMSMGSMMADEVNVGDVTVPQGGQSIVSISLSNPNKEYTAGQMVLTLPEGVTAVLKDNGDPTTTKGERLDGTSHTIGATHLENGTDQFTIFSISSEPIPGTEGALFSVIITASNELAIGTMLVGTLTEIEMTTTDATPTPFNSQTFTITIGEPADTRTVLDETSTTAPTAATGVDVRVKRTINAGEWSTICLPFAMTETQVKAAFGGDVQLADFNDYEFDEVAGTISVKFVNVTDIEANHPYIIKVGEKVTEFTADGVDIDPDEAVVDFGPRRKPHQMVGTYVANTTLEWGTLFLSGNQFWYSVGNTTMKAFRAYFNFNDLLADFEDNYEARCITMSFNESTGISDNNRETINNNRCYDLQGRRVSNPGKGVFVKDGKKVIIK